MTVSISYIVFFDNLFATFVNHACGVFEILKLHVEKLHVKADGNRGHPLNNFQMIMKNLKHCSDLQTQILKFVKDLESSYNIALLIIVGVNILTVVLTGMTAIIKKTEPGEMLRMAFVSGGALCHLFWISWLGHALEVQSEKVFISAYQGEWYDMPCQLQLMIIPIMIRSLRPCRLTAGKFYIMSMESFGNALKMMISSFTVLNSMR
ncbi:putative odorant receptor 85e [Fopius arisanus]|uniref:Odorant receptor 85e n=1 Tax=Fopius arisanus TaxID=64838 RepID=A0A9R1TLY0_9HYME|nr:PREDICTED: putative odorant receptor 85e [Fopius arisanus]